MDDITVTMVCQKAGVSRQALYNHYYCLMDVLVDLFQKELSDAIKKCNTYPNWVKGFQTILEYFTSRKNMYIHVYCSSYRKEMMKMIEKYGRILVQRGIADCARDNGTEVTKKDNDFMLNFYIDVFMGIIDRYFYGNLSDDPKRIAIQCNVMMEHSLRDNLRRFAELEKETTP